MPLTLLVTRPQPQADAWLARLRGRGIAAHALPLLAIDTVIDPADLHDAWRALPRFALVMFVSPNAVSHFFAARPTTPLSRDWPVGTRAGATGPGTLQALHRAGVPPALCVAPPADAAQFDSAALWTLLQHETWAGREVMVLRGEGGRDEFASQLRAAGASVRFIQTYHRRPAVPNAGERALLAAALAHPETHLWWLTSAEAVGCLPPLAPGFDWRRARALASHPRIAERARELGFGRVDEVRPVLEAVCAHVAQIDACLQSLPP